VKDSRNSLIAQENSGNWRQWILPEFAGLGRRFSCKFESDGFSRIENSDYLLRVILVAGGGPMRPRERRETGEQDLFRSRLDQIIDMKRSPVKLAHASDWRSLEEKFGAVYHEGSRRR
jgi:hypothetical protein